MGEDELIKGMSMYGKNWRLILGSLNFNACRTNVDLKDMYRYMIRKKEVQYL